MRSVVYVGYFMKLLQHKSICLAIMSTQGRLRLLCCTASALRHPSFSQPRVTYQTGSDDWIAAILFLLDCLHIPARSASVRHQCSRTSRYDHVTSLLKELHWLRVPERIEFKLCSLVYKCLNGSGSAYLTDSLQQLTRTSSH